MDIATKKDEVLVDEIIAEAEKQFPALAKYQIRELNESNTALSAQVVELTAELERCKDKRNEYKLDARLAENHASEFARKLDSRLRR